MLRPGGIAEDALPVRRLIISSLALLSLGGCQSLLTLPVGPTEPDPFERYDKSVDTQTVRDCLSGDNARSGQPDCFYQQRDRRDAEEREPPTPISAPYGE